MREETLIFSVLLPSAEANLKPECKELRGWCFQRSVFWGAGEGVEWVKGWGWSGKITGLFREKNYIAFKEQMFCFTLF